MVKVGLVTGTSIPSVRQAPRTNVVLPVPSSPETVATSPTRSPRAIRPARRSVSSGEDEVSLSRATLFAPPARAVSAPRRRALPPQPGAPPGTTTELYPARKAAPLSQAGAAGD